MNDEIKEILERPNVYSFGDECYLYFGDYNKLKDYITTLEQAVKDTKDSADDMLYELNEENERLKEWKEDLLKENIELENIRKDAIEYITSYEAISTIQGLDKIEQNKTLDERTMNVMVERYLQVHHNLLNILQNGSYDND